MCLLESGRGRALGQSSESVHSVILVGRDMRETLPFFFCLILLIATPWAACQVVINEIMYHDLTNDPAEEFVELHNAGSGQISLEGWRFEDEDGNSLVFPAGVKIEEGGYLVIVVDSTTFISRHPDVVNVAGDFPGRLANGGERIALLDNLSRTVDSVEYDDSYPWSASPDGQGPSLELTNPLLDNAVATSWEASSVTGGTPGRVNSGYDKVSPIANAGVDVFVPERTAVYLNGSGSVDPDGEIVSFAWVQTSGTPVSILKANTPAPYFAGPQVGETTVLTFELTVGDNDGRSSSATVRVTVVDIAGTLTPAVVPSSTSWDAGGSPYIVRENVTIPEGITLTIEPGVVVELFPGASINVCGQLIAEGNDDQRILFTRVSGIMDRWGYLRFVGSQGSVLRHCTFEYGSKPGNFSSSIPERSALYIADSDMDVEECTFQYFDDYVLTAERSTLDISGSFFYETGEGINLTDCIATIEQNRIEGVANGDDAIDINADWIHGPPTPVIISGNVVLRSSGDGIDLGGCSPLITGNLIYLCADKGISLGEGSDPRIENNILIMNGIGIAVKDGSNPEMANNTIVGNLVGLNYYRKENEYGGGRGTAVNCIVWGNDGDVAYDNLSLPKFTHSIVGGASVWPGQGNLNVDPLFLDADRNDLRLLSESAGFDSATDKGCPEKDFNGETRPQGLGPDMGALEGKVSGHDMDRDGVLDDADVFPLDVRYALDQDADGLPDEWETQFFGDMIAGPLEDPVGDNLPNGEEYLKGTNPASSAHVSVVINEIHYHPASENNAEEFIELYNRSNSIADVSLWGITDEVLFTFPVGTIIPPFGYLVMAKDPPTIEARHGIQNVYGPYARSLSNAGGVVRLVDEQQVSVCEVPYSDAPPWPSAADGDGPSLELKQPDLAPNQAENWESSWVFSGTPGKHNSIVEGPVVINEFMASPTFGDDWIELHNTTDQEIDLSGYYLSDDGDNLTRYELLEGKKIAANGFLLITQTERGFGLSSGGETIYLTAPDGESIWSQYRYGDQLPGVSQGRHPDGGAAWYSYMFGTPGRPNSAPTIFGGVVINEVYYHPELGTRYTPRDGEEFVEIYNNTDREISLTGWAFLDGFTYHFPLGTMLSPHSYLIIGHNPTEVEEYFGVTGVLGPFESGKLSNSGERIALHDNLGNLVDAVTYADGGAWPTTPDGDGASLELIHPDLDNGLPACWAASVDVPTPGDMNSVFSDNIPPEVVSVIHSPTIPTSSDAVLVQARIVDHDGSVTSAEVFFKKDKDDSYDSLAMIREGDSDMYRATLPGQRNGTLVEFFIRAEDDKGAVTVRPEGAPEIVSAETGGPVTVSYLYIVDESNHPTNMPVYRLLVTEENLTEIEARPLTSDVLLSAGLVYDNQPFYDAAIRYREQNRWRRGIRIELRGSERLHGERKINLSKYHAMEEHLSIMFYEMAGIPVYMARDIELLMNTSAKGYYLDIERLDEDFAQRHFPGDSDGTLVRGRWEVIQGDNLAAIDHLWDETLWRCGHSRFVEFVDAEMDISQWIRCLAAMAIVADWDTLLGGGTGNYINYRRPSDGRILLLPFDMDEAWHSPRIAIHGDTTLSRHADIRIEKFLLLPPFRREFYEDIIGFIDDTFSPDNLFPLIEEVCARTSRSSYWEGVHKAFVEERIEYLEQVIENCVDQSECFAAVVQTNRGARFFTDQEEVTIEGTVLPGSAAVKAYRIEDDAPNLLINGGFEDGTAGWSVEELPPYVSVALDNSVSRSGQASMRVAIDGDDPDYYGVVQIVGCRPLTKYKLSYFIRATDMDKGNMFVNVVDADNGEEYLSVYIPEQRQIGEFVWVRNDCDWTNYSGIVTTGENTHRLAVRICRVEIYHAISGEAEGTIWYDDLSLKEVDSGRQSLGLATYDPETGQWGKQLLLSPGENVFEFASYPLASRDYRGPRMQLSIYRSDDVDEDGLADLWEGEYLGSLTWGSADDPDGDELTNEVEFLARTHPNFADTDQDGLPDGWEVRYGLDATSAQDVLWDSDGDGLSDFVEYTMGTDPSDPTSGFAVLQLARDAGEIGLVWNSLRGEKYQVFRSEDMISWTPLGDPITANDTETHFADPAAEERTRFYKVELLQ